MGFAAQRDTVHIASHIAVISLHSPHQYLSLSSGLGCRQIGETLLTLSQVPVGGLAALLIDIDQDLRQTFIKVRPLMLDVTSDRYEPSRSHAGVMLPRAHPASEAAHEKRTKT
jgi:hypothetical protein